MQDATDDDAAISMFRLGRKPTIAQFQASGRVPKHEPYLQTDRRECIEHNEHVLAAKDHCMAAFESLIEHLHGRPHSFSSYTNQKNTHQPHDKCPFYVRWEVPKYTLADIEKIKHEKLMQKQEDERHRAMADHIKFLSSRNNSPTAAQLLKNPDEPEELDSDIVRWPLNPIAFEDESVAKLKKLASSIEPEFKVHAISNNDYINPSGSKSDNLLDNNNLEEHEQDDDVKEFLHSLFTNDGNGASSPSKLKNSPINSKSGGRGILKNRLKRASQQGAASLQSNLETIAASINPSGDVYEEVEMDPLYGWVKDFEEKHSEDALWRIYFPKTEPVVRHRKVHPMNHIVDPFAHIDDDKKKNKKNKKNKNGVSSSSGASQQLTSSNSSVTSLSSMSSNKLYLYLCLPYMRFQQRRRHQFKKKLLASAKKPLVVYQPSPPHSPLQNQTNSLKNSQVLGSDRLLNIKEEGKAEEKEVDVSYDVIEDLAVHQSDKAEVEQGKEMSEPMGQVEDNGLNQSSEVSEKESPKKSDVERRNKILQKHVKTKFVLLTAGAGKNKKSDENTGESATTPSPRKGKKKKKHGLKKSEGFGDGFEEDSENNPYFVSNTSWRDELGDLFYGDEDGLSFDSHPEVEEVNGLPLNGRRKTHRGEEDQDDVDNTADRDMFGNNGFDNSLEIQHFDDGEEIMTEASYELRGLCGSILPTSVALNVKEISLWGASKDPHFPPLTSGDLLGLPPNTAEHESASAENLLVTYQQRRQYTSAVKKASRRATARVMKRYKELSKERAEDRKAQEEEKKLKSTWSYKLKHIIGTHKDNNRDDNDNDDDHHHRRSTGSMGASSRNSIFGRSLPSIGQHRHHDSELDIQKMIDHATSKAIAKIQELPQELHTMRGGARVSVILLGVFEMTDTPMDFDPSVHGLFGCFPHPTSGLEYRGIILPPLPERRELEVRTPAPPFWIEGDPTALEGYALNRRHILKRVAQNAGFLGPCTDSLFKTMKVIRFQIIDYAQMTFAEYRQEKQFREMEEHNKFHSTLPSLKPTRHGKNRVDANHQHQDIVVEDISEETPWNSASGVNGGVSVSGVGGRNVKRSSTSAPGSDVPKQVDRHHHVDVASQEYKRKSILKSETNKASNHSKHTEPVDQQYGSERGGRGERAPLVHSQSFNTNTTTSQTNNRQHDHASKKSHHHQKGASSSSPLGDHLLASPPPSDLFPIKTDAIRSTNTAPGRSRQPLGIPLRPQVFSDE